jgi:hypothetical protein
MNNTKIFKPFLGSDEVYDFNIIIVKAHGVRWVNPDIEEYAGVKEFDDTSISFYEGNALEIEIRDEDKSVIQLAIVSKGLEKLWKDETYDINVWGGVIMPMVIAKVLDFCKTDDSFAKTSTGLRVSKKFDFDSNVERRWNLSKPFVCISKLRNSWQLGCRKW